MGPPDYCRFQKIAPRVRNSRKISKIWQILQILRAWRAIRGTKKNIRVTRTKRAGSNMLNYMAMPRELADVSRKIRIFATQMCKKKRSSDSHTERLVVVLACQLTAKFAARLPAVREKPNNSKSARWVHFTGRRDTCGGRSCFQRVRTSFRSEPLLLKYQNMLKMQALE